METSKRDLLSSLKEIKGERMGEKKKDLKIRAKNEMSNKTFLEEQKKVLDIFGCFVTQSYVISPNNAQISFLRFKILFFFFFLFK